MSPFPDLSAFSDTLSLLPKYMVDALVKSQEDNLSEPVAAPLENCEVQGVVPVDQQPNFFRRTFIFPINSLCAMYGFSSTNACHL